MSLAIPGAGETGVIALALVHCLAIQIGEPCLDIPCRDKYGDSLSRLSRINTRLATRFFELSAPFQAPNAITVYDVDESLPVLITSGSGSTQFYWETLSYELLACTFSRGRLLHSHVPR